MLNWYPQGRIGYSIVWTPVRSLLILANTIYNQVTNEQEFVRMIFCTLRHVGGHSRDGLCPRGSGSDVFI